YPERDQMRLEECACALEHREEPPVELRQRGLEHHGVLPSGKCERFPCQLIQVLTGPRGLERCRVAGAEQPLQRGGEAAQQGQGLHAREATAPIALVHNDLENRVEIVWARTPCRSRG